MVDNGHILLVDDEPEVCDVVEQYLSQEGYRVSVAANGEEMRQVIEQSPVDLLLLDVMLPREDGLSLVRALRSDKLSLPIIMLTGRSDTIDRIIGLEMGADDYLAKPFHLRELLARIKGVMRRAAQSSAESPPAGDSPQISFCGWHLNRSTRELFSPNGESVRLTGGEFDLLVALVTHPQHVLSREQLLDLVRGRKADPFDRTVDVQVGRLRRKLGAADAQSARLIKTVRGGGYVFSGAVESPPG
jgi:two-component system OmpR family response regulator